MRTEDAWKFDTPAIERTLNQSLFLDSLCTDPLHRFQKFNPNSGAAEAGKDHYKVLPESKQAAGANGVCEPQDGTWPSSSRLMPTGLQANSCFSKPVTPPSRAWMQETCTLHPHERVCELSAWKQQLEKMRLQVEQMQLQNGGACHHPSMYPPSLPTPDPAQWINILNSNENLLKEKELLIDSLQDKVQQCVKNAERGPSAQDGERQKIENDSLKKECDRLRKIVDKQQKKMEQLSLQVKNLEEQVAQEEGTSQALKEEAMRRENALQQLRNAVKEQEKRQFLPGELQLRLWVVVEDAELASWGQQGVVQHSTKEKDDLLSPDGLAKKLAEVKQLHKEVEDLRTAISDRYAQDMGDNCITQILDGKNIKYELVDISQDNALREEMRAKAGNPKAIPPQIVNGDHYCGDYELFVEAVEQNTLQEFLKLA
ncbi:centrosomal protein of 85 kda [Limosa lapponica baueri]|uniref:Centrosomal protein of 85 kDa n=2 Tax=Neoaves TaxID=3078114 RepID=A0A2I0TGH2_LIMLA|nr:centrosomal protein of 85 kda [Limosa lapponica baueri]